MSDSNAALPSEPPLELPKSLQPRPGALSLLTPAQRGLALAIMQADRCGRGGEDLEILGGARYSKDGDHASLLNGRISMLQRFGLPRSESKRG